MLKEARASSTSDSSTPPLAERTAIAALPALEQARILWQDDQHYSPELKRWLWANCPATVVDILASSLM
jgi:hypothetical protein